MYGNMIWYMTGCDMWYDVIYDMMWNTIWCDIWYDVIYDMYGIWYDVIWYDIWYIICDISWIWYDMMWYVMLCYAMLCYDMIWYDMICDMIRYDTIWLATFILSGVNVVCSSVSFGANSISNQIYISCSDVECELLSWGLQKRALFRVVLAKIFKNWLSPNC